jgi:cold shock protein
LEGTVRFFDSEVRGFGFIAPDRGKPDAPRPRDVFVHIREIERCRLNTLSEGQRVSFDVTTDRRSGRPCANNLRIIADAERAKGEAERVFAGKGRRVLEASAAQANGWPGS